MSKLLGEQVFRKVQKKKNQRKICTLCIEDSNTILTYMDLDISNYSSLEELRNKIRPYVYPEHQEQWKKEPLQPDRLEDFPVNLVFSTWEVDYTYAKYRTFLEKDHIAMIDAISLFGKTIQLDATPGHIFLHLPPDDDDNPVGDGDNPDEDHGPPASSEPDVDNTHRPPSSQTSDPQSPLSDLPPSPKESTQTKAMNLLLAACSTFIEKQQADGRDAHSVKVCQGQDSIPCNQRLDFNNKMSKLLGEHVCRKVQKKKNQRKICTLCIEDSNTILTYMDLDISNYSSLEELRDKVRPDVYPEHREQLKKEPLQPDRLEDFPVNLVFSTWEVDYTYAKYRTFLEKDHITMIDAISLFGKTIQLDATPGHIFLHLPPDDDDNPVGDGDNPDEDHGPPASSEPDLDNTHRPPSSQTSDPQSPLSELPPSPKESTQTKAMNLLLAACSTFIEKQQADGRDAHSLKVFQGQDCISCNGRWNFNNKEIDRPFTPAEEDQPWRRLSPVVRVDMMIEQIKLKLSGPTKLLLCVLPDLYGPWKKKNPSEMGICCISPVKINNQYLEDQYQVVAICYAYDAASQVGQLIKFDDFLETSSGDGAITDARPVPVQELPRLHKNVRSSMSLC